MSKLQVKPKEILDTLANVLFTLVLEGSYCFDDGEDVREIVSRFSTSLNDIGAFENLAQVKLWEARVLGDE